jgi:hypothetical protein
LRHAPALKAGQVALLTSVPPALTPIPAARCLFWCSASGVIRIRGYRYRLFGYLDTTVPTCGQQLPVCAGSGILGLPCRSPAGVGMPAELCHQVHGLHLHRPPLLGGNGQSNSRVPVELACWLGALCAGHGCVRARGLPAVAFMAGTAALLRWLVTSRVKSAGTSLAPARRGELCHIPGVVTIYRAFTDTSSPRGGSLRQAALWWGSDFPNETIMRQARFL